MRQLSKSLFVWSIAAAVFGVIIVIVAHQIANAFQGPATSVGVGNGAIGINAANNLSVGTSTPLPESKFLIVASSTGANEFALKILQPDKSPILFVRNDGSVSIATASFGGSGLTIQGGLYVSGNISGKIAASNVTAAVFDAGNFAFPSSLGINTSTSVLPQPLSVYGNAYISGNVGIGTTNPGVGLDVTTGMRVSGVTGPSSGAGVEISFASDNGYLQAYNRASSTYRPFYIYGAPLSLNGNAGGNVGIGTTGPGALLTVQKDQNTNTDVRVYNAVAGASGMARFVLGYNSAATGCRSWGIQTPTPGAAGNFSISDLGCDPASNGTPALTIAYGTGNVGIGTTAPGQKLEVAGNVSSSAVCLGGACNSAWPTTLSGGQANYIPIWTSATAQGTSTIYQSGGNVGIGTASPDTKLQVKDGNDRIAFYQPSDNRLAIQTLLDDRAFATYGTYGGSENRLILQPLVGNVGIGTSSPAYTLDVNGTIRGTTILGAYSGAIAASNVSQGVFGMSQGNGDFAFPASLGIATSSQVGLPATLSVYGSAYVSGNVGIGETSPGAKLSFPRLDVSSDADGITWYSPSPTSYGIYKTAGAWSGPNYQQLKLAWGTGIIIDGGSAYGKSGTVLQPSGGNVGIGTANPSLGRLQVFNNTDVTNTFFQVAKNDGGSSEAVIINDDRGFAGINSGKSFVVRTRNDGLNDTGAIASFETIGGSTINALWVGINGNVGIGTTVPATKLHIYALTGTESKIRIQNAGTAAADTAALELIGGSANAYWSLITNRADIAGAADSIALYKNSGTTGTKLVVQNNGNVGIGTTGPNAKLEVGSGSWGTNLSTALIVNGGALGGTAGNYAYPAEIQNVAGNLLRLQFAPYRRTTGAGWGGTAYRIQYAVDNSFTDGSKAYIELGGDDPNAAGGGFISLGTAGSDRLSITNGGNVGIGTTGPGYKLDVVSGGGTTARFGTAAADTVVIGGGAGKITVGTVDPIYTIGNAKYATYLPAMTGQK